MPSGLFEKKAPTGHWWSDHSLSLVLAAILAAQTILAILTGHYVWVNEAPFGTPAPWSASFWIWWTWEYNISLVADTFGVLLIVLLSKWLREVGSAESQ